MTRAAWESPPDSAFSGPALSSYFSKTSVLSLHAAHGMNPIAARLCAPHGRRLAFVQIWYSLHENPNTPHFHSGSSLNVKDVELDLDSVRVIKSVVVIKVVLGDDSIEKKTSSKTKNLICIVGREG